MEQHYRFLNQVCLRYFKLILVMFLVLISGCVTSSTLRKVKKQERKENIEEAYSIIDKAHQKRPKNSKLYMELARLRHKVIDFYLDKESSCDRYDLNQRKDWLTKANAIVDYYLNDERESRLDAINAKIEVFKNNYQKFEASSDLLEKLIYYQKIKGYQEYFGYIPKFNEDEDLLTGQVIPAIEKLVSSGNASKAAVYCLVAQKIWPDCTQLKDTSDKILTDNSDELLKKAYKYRDCKGKDRLLTAMTYAIAAWRTRPSNEEALSCVTDLQKQIIDDQRRTEVIVDLPRNLTEKYQKHFLDRFDYYLWPLLALRIDKLEGSLPGVLIQIELKDRAIETTKQPNTEYSEYHAGYENVPNPAYQRAAARCDNARMYAAGGGLLPMAMAMSARNDLAQIPQYLQRPFYQSYPYTKTIIKYYPRLYIEYRVTDLINGVVIEDKSIDIKDEYCAEQIDGAHPKDRYDLQNVSVKEDEAEEVLDKFSLLELDLLAKKLASHANNHILFDAKDALADGYADHAREMILRYTWEPCIKSTNKYFELPTLSSNINNYLSEDIELPAIPLEDSIAIPAIMKSTVDFGLPLPEELPSLQTAISDWDPMAFQYKKRTVDFKKANAIIKKLALKKKDSAVSAKQRALSQSGDKFLNDAMSAVVVVRTAFGNGSGFIINSNGYILSNQHVIKDANDIFIELHDGGKYPAKVIDVSISRDLALLKIPADKLPYISFGTIDHLSIGENVYAIGAPGGILKQTVTKGIVSAIREMGSITNPDVKVKYVQTDAAINKGNSGGPLITADGKAVGINSQKVTAVGVEGLGFAIAIDEAMDAFDDHLRADD